MVCGLVALHFLGSKKDVDDKYDFKVGVLIVGGDLKQCWESIPAMHVL